MPCLTNYNIVQEGDLYNDTVIGNYPITSSGFSGLYDGDYTSISYTLPASGVSSAVLEFGEYVDICNIKYYVSPISLSDFSMSYGLESPDENSLVLSSSPRRENISIALHRR